MPKSTVSSPSTLDERAAAAAKYQRDVELVFSTMEKKQGEPFDMVDLPVIRDAFKHIALLPWMQHALTLFTTGKPVFGLRLPYPECWTYAGAWDYESTRQADGPRRVCSNLWLRAGTLDLWITQNVALGQDTNLQQKLVFTYTFHLKSKKALDADVTVETLPHTKELVPMDTPDIGITALAKILEGVVRLVWLDQQEDQ